MRFPKSKKSMEKRHTWKVTNTYSKLVHETMMTHTYASAIGTVMT